MRAITTPPGVRLSYELRHGQLQHSLAHDAFGALPANFPNTAALRFIVLVNGLGRRQIPQAFHRM